MRPPQYDRRRGRGAVQARESQNCDVTGRWQEGQGDATEKPTYEPFDPLPTVGEIFQIDFDALNMATFAPIPYKYVPTASRPRGAKSRRKPILEQSSILNDHSPAKQMGVALDAPWPAVGAAADENGSGMPGDQVESSIAYFGNSGDYDDDYFPTIEELLHTKLQKAGFGVGEPGKEHIRGAVEECLGEVRSIDQSTSALRVSSSGDQGNPIELRDDEFCASEDEIDCASRSGNVNGDQEIFSRTETVLNPNLTPPSDPDQESSILDSMRPSSEPLHGRINTEDPFTACAKSETTKSLSTCHRGQSPRRPRSSQQSRLSQEDRASRRQAKPEFDNNTSEEMLPQQQDEEENINSNDDGLQHSDENTARVAPITEMGDELHLPASVIRRTSLAKRHRIVSPRSPSLEPSQEQATSNSDNCSDDEPSTTEAESDKSDRRRCPTKRKRPSSSYVGPTQRKRGQHFQLGSTQQGRNCSPQRHRWKPHNHGSRVALACNVNSQLPSPPRSSLDCGTLSESSKHTQPLLTEVTFRPHSPNCLYFSAFIQDDRVEPELSFGQLSKLIECVGHAGNIEDLTIKPLKQHSFLVTGFSRLTSSRPSQSGKTVRSTTNACLVPLGARRTRLDKGGSASAFPSQRRETSRSVGSDDDACSSEDELGRLDTRKYSQWSPSSSIDDNGFGDGELNPGSNDGACSSEGDVGYSSEDDVGRSVKYSRWSPLEKQRLAAYKKEDKSLKWIFSKFPGRTEGAVRTRWSTMQPKVK
ncbi:hypothetical protein V501_01302 [Pseudogymnoascus sp. VKM F-4519 (FW-2642)]|nr:hypothetical protein V501_01302 [Pseudogymnoascus sp. VKM F-4519 (FW-2642)]